MHQHARQPHAAPAWLKAAATDHTSLAWPEPHEGPEEVPTESWVVLQLQQALSPLLLPETLLQQSLKSHETPVVSAKALLQGLQHFIACQV